MTLPNPLLPILLTDEQLNAAQGVASILTTSLSDQEIDARIHRLFHSLYHTTHPERSSKFKQDPIFLFLMYLSVNKAGTFDDAGYIASRLSGLFYVMRMVAVKEIFEQARVLGDVPNAEFRWVPNFYLYSGYSVLCAVLHPSFSPRSSSWDIHLSLIHS